MVLVVGVVGLVLEHSTLVVMLLLLPSAQGTQDVVLVATFGDLVLKRNILGMPAHLSVPSALNILFGVGSVNLAPIHSIWEEKDHQNVKLAQHTQAETPGVGSGGWVPAHSIWEVTHLQNVSLGLSTLT